jgi:hypothetical protein
VVGFSFLSGKPSGKTSIFSTPAQRPMRRANQPGQAQDAKVFWFFFSKKNFLLTLV